MYGSPYGYGGGYGHPGMYGGFPVTPYENVNGKYYQLKKEKGGSSSWGLFGLLTGGLASGAALSTVISKPADKLGKLGRFIKGAGPAGVALSAITGAVVGYKAGGTYSGYNAVIHDAKDDSKINGSPGGQAMPGLGWGGYGGGYGGAVF